VAPIPAEYFALFWLRSFSLGPSCRHSSPKQHAAHLKQVNCCCFGGNRRESRRNLSINKLAKFRGRLPCKGLMVGTEVPEETSACFMSELASHPATVL
jgi:hypothetical protein